jgi:hypothetical protein
LSVVAYRDGVMAADSRINSGDTHHYTMDKMIRGNSGELIGVVGDVAEIQRFMNWYTGGEEEQGPKKNFDALVVLDDGQVVGYFDDLVPIPLHGSYFAIGSGSDIALGAMSMGATAEEAVVKACEHSSSCGLPIKTMVRMEYDARADQEPHSLPGSPGVQGGQGDALGQ